MQRCCGVYPRAGPCFAPGSWGGGDGEGVGALGESLWSWGSGCWVGVVASEPMLLFRAGGGDGFQEGCSFGEKAKCILKASLEPVLHGCEHLKSCNRKKNTNRLLRCLDVKGTALF